MYPREAGSSGVAVCGPGDEDRPRLSGGQVESCRDVSTGIDDLLVTAAPLLTPSEIRALQAARDVINVLVWLGR